MTVYFAQSNSNIDAANLWNTSANGSGSYLTWPPASGDVLMANGKTIAINVSTDLGSTGEIRNSNANGATAGGGFTLAAGITLTANIYSGSTATACVTCSLTSPDRAYIVGTLTGTSTAKAVTTAESGHLTFTGSLGNYAFYHNSIGSLDITASSSGSYAVINAGLGTINFYGSITAAATDYSYIIQNLVGGTVNLTGNVTGNFNGVSNRAILNIGTGAINVTGIVTSGGYSELKNAIENQSTGTVTVNGSVVGANSAYGSAGSAQTGAPAIRNHGGGIVTINGTVVAGTATPALANHGAGYFVINGEIQCSSTGFFPIHGRFRLNPTQKIAAVDANLTPITLGTDGAADGYLPVPANVRSGLAYGFGVLTGACAVPAPNQVVAGVAVDNTVGTALITAASIRDELATELGRIDATVSSRSTFAASELDNQFEALPTAAENALAIRSELATELGRIDVAISSRSALTTDDIPSVPSASTVADAVRSELTPELETITAINDRIELQVPEGPVLVIPAPATGQTTAWTYCYNEEGKAEKGVKITVQLHSVGAAASSAWDTAPITVTSNDEGLAVLEIPRKAGLQFKVKRNQGPWVKFSGVNAETLELPAILGED